MGRKKTKEDLDREILEYLALPAGHPSRDTRMDDINRRNSEFDTEWYRLEIAGKADAWGSTEYQRVKRKWISAGRPEPIKAFIRHGISNH